MRVVVRYENGVINSISRASLVFFMYQNLDPWGEDFSKRKNIEQTEFRPSFDHRGTLVWKCKETSEGFTTEQLAAHVLESIPKAIAALHAEAASRNE